MKVTFIVLLSWLLSTPSFSQSSEVFRVVVVSGKVENAKLRRLVQKGDEIHDNESLVFGTKDSYIIVISPQTGRKTIRGVTDAAPRELKELLQSFLRPDEKSTASRGLATEYWSRLNESLVDTVLILGDGIVTLNSEYIRLAPPAVIVASYKSKKGEHITRVISSGQNMCLGKNCLLNDGAENSSKIMVEYYPNEKVSRTLPGSGEFIGYFWPRYSDDAKIESEVRIIVQTLGKSPREDMIDEIKKFLTEEYGRVEELNLLAWLQSKKFIAP